MCLKSYLLMDSAAFELQCFTNSPFTEMYMHNDRYIIYGPEAYLMHLTDRCRFLNCSVRMGGREVMALVINIACIKIITSRAI